VGIRQEHKEHWYFAACNSVTAYFAACNSVTNSANKGLELLKTKFFFRKRTFYNQIYLFIFFFCFPSKATTLLNLYSTVLVKQINFPCDLTNDF